LTLGFSKPAPIDLMYARDEHRLDDDQLFEAARVAPGEEAPAGAVVGSAGAGVIDSDGEKLQEAPPGLVAGCRDDRRHRPRSTDAGSQCAGFEDDEVARITVWFHVLL